MVALSITLSYHFLHLGYIVIMSREKESSGAVD